LGSSSRIITFTIYGARRGKREGGGRPLQYTGEIRKKEGTDRRTSTTTKKNPFEDGKRTRKKKPTGLLRGGRTRAPGCGLASPREGRKKKKVDERCTHLEKKKGKKTRDYFVRRDSGRGGDGIKSGAEEKEKNNNTLVREEKRRGIRLLLYSSKKKETDHIVVESWNAAEVGKKRGPPRATVKEQSEGGEGKKKSPAH